MTTTDPYQILGVAMTATTEEIRKAYRRRAKETHPDAGGHAADFAAVVNAAELLLDPERRKRYDSGASDGDGLTAEEERAWVIVIDAVQILLDNREMSAGNPPMTMLSFLTMLVQHRQEELENQIAAVKRKIAMAEAMRTKITPKNDLSREASIMTTVITSGIDILQERLKSFQERVKDGRRAMGIFGAFSPGEGEAKAVLIQQRSPFFSLIYPGS
jgi:curved DNA-binding protein CbpA